MNPPFEEKYLASRLSGLRKLRILVAPLDWGLGHATRCIPIIYELLNNNCEVWLAGEGSQESLLKQEFPELPFIPLQGYRVKYGRSGAGTVWNIFVQSRKILKAIRKEHDWLKNQVKAHGFDAIISDNRYGLYHSGVPCIFITHQLTIKGPWKWTRRLLQKRNYRFINRFKECWVPDSAHSNNLAGELSHPLQMPAIPVKYIGPLSRFDDENIIPDPGLQVEPGNLLIILSGPEPQRSIFENKIINDIAHYPGTATIIRGLPASANLVPSTNSIRFYNHLPTNELTREMNKAEYVISRSGYSTIMDIMALQKKSILIPTPGQTEQEYLGHYLQEKKAALTISQNSFSLSAALQSAKTFSYHIEEIKKENNLQQVISQFVFSLQQH